MSPVAGGSTKARRGEEATAPARAAGPKPPSKNKLRRIADLERQIEKSEKAMATLEDELADPASWASPEKSEASTRRHDDLKERIEELYAEWEEAGGAPCTR